MNLDEAQRNKVAAWIAEGLKLSDIQTRLASELGIRMTYMDVRFLVDDLKLVPKDVEPAKMATTLATSAPTAEVARTLSAPSSAATPDPSASPNRVSVVVDQIARPGAVVSGNVTFTDGHKADWYLDQSGRLAFVPQQTGYRPAAADLQQFQTALEKELSRMGF